MEHKLNLHKALNAFYKITSYGVERDGEYHLNGLAAASDFDGYTVVLRDDYVTLRIYFHNKYDLEYTKKAALDAFLERLQAIDKASYQSRS